MADSGAVKRRAWPWRHPVAFWIIIAAVLLVAAAGYTVAKVASMALNLKDLGGLSSTLSSSVSKGDFDALNTALADARGYAEEAEAQSTDPAVWIAAHQPLFGADIAAMVTVSGAAVDLIDAAEPVVAALPALTAADGLDPTTLALLSEQLTGLNDVLAPIGADLSTIDTSELIDQLAEPISEVQTGLTQVQSAVTNLTPFVSALPILMDPDTNQTWFVMMQNLAEARTSGGLLSAYAIMQAGGGDLKMVAQGNNNDLSKLVIPDDSMPEGLQEVWGDYLGKWLSLNLSANFPDNAQMIAKGWKQYSGDSVDGVVALGQGTLQYLGAAVGPVEVRGKTIKPAELKDYLTLGVYEDYPDASEKDEVVAEIITAIFTKLAAGTFDVQSMLTTALSGDTGDYLQMWSEDADVQSQIEAAGLSGELPDTNGPVTSVRVVNAGANKLDAFLQLDVDYSLGRCIVDSETETGTRSGTVTVTVTNTAPASGLPAYVTPREDTDERPVGSNRSLVLVYPPVDAYVDAITRDGREDAAVFGTERGREFAVMDIDLDPGASTTMEFTWNEPTQDADGEWVTGDPQVITQPMILAPEVTTSTQGQCS